VHAQSAKEVQTRPEKKKRREETGKAKQDKEKRKRVHRITSSTSAQQLRHGGERETRDINAEVRRNRVTHVFPQYLTQIALPERPKVVGFESS